MLIDKYILEILENVSKYPILLLSAPTGSGKSLVVPNALARTHYKVKVFISVPTRLAAISLANTQKKIFESNAVGYAAEGDVRYNDKSRIVYVTSGHLRKKLLSYSDKPWNFCTVLIIDEVHSGTIDNTVNLALWEDAARKGIETPRLILSSATISKEILKRFPEAFKFEITGKNFPIEITYHDQDFDPKEDTKRLYHAMADVIRDVVSKQKGDLLAFVPGENEVRTLYEYLSELKISGSELLQIYGSMDSFELDKINAKTNNRRIIIATNIAETALTIENLTIVVDSMLEKVAETSSSGGLRLALKRISKSSAIQRCGRTGRIAPGFCYRMITEAEYTKLDQERVDEIHRRPISYTLLELINSGIDVNILKADLTEAEITSSIRELKEYKCLTDSGKITHQGKFVADFPYGLKDACILYRWIQDKKALLPIVVLLSLIEGFGPSYFWVPKREPKEVNQDYLSRVHEHQVKYFRKFKGKSDLNTLLNLWLVFLKDMDGFPRGEFINVNFNEGKVKTWCVENSIHHRKWKDFLTIMRLTINKVLSMNLTLTPGIFNVENVIRVARPYFEEFYDILQLKGTSYEDKFGEKYKLDTRRSINDLDIFTDVQIINIISVELGDQVSGYRLVSVALDDNPDGRRESRTSAQEEPVEKKAEIPKATEKTPERRYRVSSEIEETPPLETAKKTYISLSPPPEDIEPVAEKPKEIEKAVEKPKPALKIVRKAPKKKKEIPEEPKVEEPKVSPKVSRKKKEIPEEPKPKTSPKVSRKKPVEKEAPKEKKVSPKVSRKKPEVEGPRVEILYHMKDGSIINKEFYDEIIYPSEIVKKEEITYKVVSDRIVKKKKIIWEAPKEEEQRTPSLKPVSPPKERSEEPEIKKPVLPVRKSRAKPKVEEDIIKIDNPPNVASSVDIPEKVVEESKSKLVPKLKIRASPRKK